MTDSAAEARIDQALVTRVLLANDRRAFEQLLRRHQGMVRAQLRRLLHGDHATADDLAQETFLLAWRKLDQFRGDSRFSTWLYRIAYSCFLQAYRKKSTISVNDDDGEIDQLPAPAHAVDLQMDVDRAMQRLSSAEQAVLLHCVQLGLSHEETAYVLAMPHGKNPRNAWQSKVENMAGGVAPSQRRGENIMSQQHDDAIEALLCKQFDGPLRDDGFCDRVMQRLPERRRRPVWPLVVGMVGGIIACWLTLPLLHIGSHDWGGSELSTSAIVMLLVAAGMSMLAACWAMTEADDR